jgi:hypothetical protein
MRAYARESVLGAQLAMSLDAFELGLPKGIPIEGVSERSDGRAGPIGLEAFELGLPRNVPIEGVSERSGGRAGPIGSRVGLDA